MAELAKNQLLRADSSSAGNNTGRARRRGMIDIRISAQHETLAVVKRDASKQHAEANFRATL